VLDVDRVLAVAKRHGLLVGPALVVILVRQLLRLLLILIDRQVLLRLLSWNSKEALWAVVAVVTRVVALPLLILALRPVRAITVNIARIPLAGRSGGRARTHASRVRAAGRAAGVPSPGSSVAQRERESLRLCGGRRAITATVLVVVVLRCLRFRSQALPLALALRALALLDTPPNEVLAAVDELDLVVLQTSVCRYKRSKARAGC
jgi:hypothetical protein